MPAVTVPRLLVLVMVRSAVGVSESVSLAELFPGFGSTVPFGTTTDAALVTVPVAVLETFTVSLNVAEPPTARLTALLLMLTTPLDSLQLEPEEAVHVHETIVSGAGKISLTVAPVTALGPALVTTML